jgi:DNA replication and repair protein RecF
LHLRSLRTVQWRNIEDAEVEFSPGVNVLVGGNGQGKTNFLEAVHYLALGRSHRGSRDEEIVRFGGDHFYARGVGQGDAGETFSIEAGFTPPRSKRLKVDGQPVARLTDVMGVLACVSFGPEDAELTRGAPQLRRRYVDYALAETSRSSLKLLSEYRRSVQQRAALLRDTRRPEPEIAAGLAVWDDEQVRLGRELMSRRAEALAGLGPLLHAAFARLGGGYELRLRYAVHAAGRSFEVGLELQELQSAVADGSLAAAYRERLRLRRQAERARGQSLVGPHRDDLELIADGRDLRRFGSQGQCRVAAVALKLAQAEFIAARRGEPPVVLMDDVFAELDEQRAGALWSLVSERHQTFLAMPRAGDVELGRGGAVFEVRNGRLRRGS